MVRLLGRLGQPVEFPADPSQRASDIERQRVEGVHGPRVLDVIVVVGPAHDR